LTDPQRAERAALVAGIVPLLVRVCDARREVFALRRAERGHDYDTLVQNAKTALMQAASSALAQVDAANRATPGGILHLTFNVAYSGRAPRPDSKRAAYITTIHARLATLTVGRIMADLQVLADPRRADESFLILRNADWTATIG
jgi:hypothetical protein